MKDHPTNDFDQTRERIHRQMLSAVSHDLKTPLATIIGSLEVYIRMEHKLTPDKKLMLINSAMQEAYRLDTFVTNILDMAKLEGGAVKIKCEKSDLATLVQECVTRLGTKSEKGAIAICPPLTPTVVYTDPMLITRALSILLDNALKHAGAKPLITINYGMEVTDAWISIADNGPGIPQDKMEAIFSKYTRFSKSDQQNAGTGLGLAICRLIMELLSGSVTVRHRVDGESGAEFTLHFPCK